MSIQRSPLRFFGLVFLLTVPFWLLGALTGLSILPALPISALAVICPAGAAAILIYREEGRAGVGALLRRSFDLGRIRAKAWLVPVFLLEPAIMALSFLVLRLEGAAIPLPQFSLLQALALFALFLASGLGEELGWMGYAADPLQGRFGPLGASLLMGLVWAAWHYIGLAQENRSLEYIAWWTLGTLAYRVIIFWLYERTGKSIFAAAVFHATVNLTWQLFPVNGSFYDPQVTGLIAAAVAVAGIIAWRPAGPGQPPIPARSPR